VTLPAIGQADRDRFLALLARAASDPGIRLTEAEAADLLRRYDADEIDASDLPLAPPEQGGAVRTAAGLALALLLLAGVRGTRPTRIDGVARVHLARARDAAADHFEQDALSLAVRYHGGRITLGEWQVTFAGRVGSELAALAYLGAGTNELPDAARAELARQTLLQAGYVSRFADDMAIRRAQGSPMTLLGMAARSALYAGAAYGLYFYSQEAAEGAGRDGYVVEYKSVDSPTTCRPCHAAEGYYLPTTGPYPGQVCRGRSRCRCRRILRFDPQVYRQLTGQARGY
jgi:hypothetical protein